VSPPAAPTNATKSPRSRGTTVSVLGATGSVGTATLDVLRALGPPWRCYGLSAHAQLDEMARLAQTSRPRRIVAASIAHAQNFDFSKLPADTQVAIGSEALIEIASAAEVDTVVAAIVGSAGLASTLAAADAGKRIALANKEALVVAGGLLTHAIQRSGGELLPVDSEHSAIFQALQAGRANEVEQIVLTASGGPFRTWPSERMRAATIDDALAHPTWQMGRKITIDSATMMNKALEIIEARWLFGLKAEQIRVVVHPQSIIHSMVEFADGSVMAQLSPPDMRLPIQYALTYPERTCSPCPRMKWTESQSLELEPVDVERFPALLLGWEVADRGGSTGAVLNAANETAVELFLSGSIRFTEIVAACRRILDQHDFDPNPTFEQLMRLDRWAREETNKWAALC
jgi:1-deoxy-D-xylulose-5-phosphate reductoisomerase